MKVLLLGGNGFLGRGLQDELTCRGADFCSLDINDIDLSMNSSIRELSSMLKDFTNVVLLAAKIGRELFNKNPIPNAQENDSIFKNVLNAMSLTSSAIGRNFDFTFYSSSEVFGSVGKDSVITSSTNTLYSTRPRGAYANQKIDSEEILKVMVESKITIDRLKILRPFNVTGKYQKRGVIYDMLSSAMKEGKIWYSDDTTRSFTTSEYAKKVAVSEILSKNTLSIKNISENITMYMKDVAELVSDCLGGGIEIIKNPPDDEIRFRQTSTLESTNESDTEKLRKVVIEMIEDMKRDDF